MNTKKKGLARIVVFKEKDGDYCAVCLNLDLIEWGKDPQKLVDSMHEAIQSYVRGVVEKGLPDELLNRPAPEKYWQMARENMSPTVFKPEEKNTLDSGFFNYITRPYSHGTFIQA